MSAEPLVRIVGPVRAARGMRPAHVNRRAGAGAVCLDVRGLRHA